VSDLKTAYTILAQPKQEALPEPKLKEDEPITIFDYEPICMKMSKEIQRKCSKAKLHPIKMDK
jgi:hypothetical protein